MEKKTKTSLFQEILDRTTLDDEAIKAITLAEEYIEQRKNNLSYIIKNFPFAVGIMVLVEQPSQQLWVLQHLLVLVMQVHPIC